MNGPRWPSRCRSIRETPAERDCRSLRSRWAVERLATGGVWSSRMAMECMREGWTPERRLRGLRKCQLRPSARRSRSRRVRRRSGTSWYAPCRYPPVLTPSSRLHLNSAAHRAHGRCSGRGGFDTMLNVRNAWPAWVFVAAVLSAAVPVAHAQSGENVAVVINESSPVSQRIGEYYARMRAVPSSQVIRIRTTTEETVSRDEFTRTIEQPIAAAITREGLHDRILYLVLTKGIPLRLSGTGGQDGTLASVDSELTLLYRRMTGEDVLVRGRIDNPLFLADRDLASARPFTHRDHDIYLVTRLDAFTVEQALALVDKGLRPSSMGRIVLDLQAKLFNRTGEDWLESAAARL